MDGMRSWLLAVGLFAAASLLLVRAPAASADVISRVSTAFDINVGSDASFLCPSGRVLGGGFDTENLDALVTRATAPVEFPLPSDPVTRWMVSILNSTGTEQAMRLAVVCGVIPGLGYERDDFSVAAGGFGADSVFCPLGRTAVGGGVARQPDGSLADNWVVGTGPYFLASPLSARLAQRPEGENPAPNGWEGGYQSEGAAGDATVTAVCADFDDVLTMVEAATVNAGATDVTTVLCPSPMRALSGGVDTEDRDGFRVLSTAPVFFGFPVIRTFNAPEQVSLAPIGWRVVVRNDGIASKPYKTAAICAPEPAATATAALASLAMLAATRRSRARR